MPQAHSVPLSDRRGHAMLDATMLIFGAGAFALFLGYVAVCDSL
jgi:hypothetical protein